MDYLGEESLESINTLSLIDNNTALPSEITMKTPSNKIVEEKYIYGYKSDIFF